MLPGSLQQLKVSLYRAEGREVAAMCAGLRSLQDLKVRLVCGIPDLAEGFSALTGLTRLAIQKYEAGPHMPTKHDLSFLTAFRELRSLGLCLKVLDGRGNVRHLAALTGLTHLAVTAAHSTRLPDACPALWEELGQLEALKGLEEVILGRASERHPFITALNSYRHAHGLPPVREV